MLPDFPRVKDQLDNMARFYLEKKAALTDPLLRQIRRTKQHEGDAHAHATVDGDLHRRSHEQFESAIQLSRDDRKDLNVPQVLERLDKIAEDLSRQSVQLMFARISEASSEAGTSFNAGGQPLTFEMFLHTIDTMQVDFDETGKPTFQIVVNPSLMPRLRKLEAELQASPDQQGRLEEVMSRKREEWRAREANRQLVD